MEAVVTQCLPLDLEPGEDHLSLDAQMICLKMLVLNKSLDGATEIEQIKAFTQISLTVSRTPRESRKRVY